LGGPTITEVARGPGSLLKRPVLLIDELGYVPADARGGDILYNIISRRHEQRSDIQRIACMCIRP
jgi:hypothetical protein